MTIALIIVGLFIAINFGRIYYQNVQVPELGITDGQFKPISKKPNNVSTQTEDDLKRVPTLPVKDSPEATMAALKKAVESFGDVEIKTLTDNYLYVVFSTSLMNYHDDVEFWLDVDRNQVHFRSASRAGYSDMGLNRKRYEKLAELYKAN